VANAGLNKEERRELFNERAELYKVYAELKQVMDYKTGIAGLSYRISDSFFTELLYVDALRGRAKVEYTRSQARKIIDRLETIGLIKRRKDIGPNVFKLLLATSNKSVQMNRVQTGSRTGASNYPEQEPEQEPIKSGSNVVDMGLSKKTGARTGYEQEPEQDTSSVLNRSPPLTSNYKLTNYTQISEIHSFLIPHVDEKSFINFHSRKLMREWIELGLGDDVLQMAVGKAVQSTQGGYFNISYLDPIIRELINKNKLGELDANDQRSKQSSSEHGSSGSYMREQREAAERYAIEQGIDISEGFE